MNRTDRLVALVMMLQSRRVTTAAEMAAHFEITERTVYRDIAALGESGVPIVGGRPPTRGAVPLSTVQQAMAAGCLLRLNYCGAARSETVERVVEPLGLVFYLDHWHLIAWCRLRDDVRDFRVDRILRCDTLPDAISPRPDFDLTEYLTHCMTAERNEFAVIEVSALSIESVRRHWGPTLVEETTLGKRVRVRFAFQTSGYDYVARWLLGLGTEAEIISPEALKDKVVTLALATAKHHAPKEFKKRKRS
jgi:predicted DNA-binding transcriptional regulator YafY